MLPSMPPPPSVSTRPRRWWLLALIWALLAAVNTAVTLRPEVERNIRSWLGASLLVLGILLSWVWFAFFSSFSARLRLALSATVLTLAVAAYMLVRVDGTLSGVGFPRLVWRWSTSSPARRPSMPLHSESEPIHSDRAFRVAEAPQFMGRNRDGVVCDVTLARNWQSDLPRLLWRQPVGAGWSAFAISGGKAYTQEQRGEDEVLTCYEALTGKPLWIVAHPARFMQWQGGEGPRATPTVDRGLVFAYGATGILECADAATGQRLWSRDILGENALANLEWGISASPLVFADTVVVSGGGNRGPTLLAYRRATGEPLWRAGTDRASYSSPTLATLAGRKVILSFNAATLTAHDPQSGVTLGSHAWSEEKIPKAAQPVVLPGDRVFLSAGYGAGGVMLQFEPGRDQGLSISELWRSLHMKNQFNTVAVREGFLYGLDDGMLACVDAATGKRRWKEGRFGSGQTLLVGELMLIQAEDGAVVLAEARPESGREVGRLAALESKTWNHPALAGNLLLVRNDREAAAYLLPLAPERPEKMSGR